MPEMSWLSPKRRRTTGNLKALPNGQYNQTSSENSPTASQKGPSTPRSERPPRPVSQPFSSNASPGSDGNLFYAYARKGDDLRSRYLLTFASASIANEWWLLAQAHFPDCTRPGPQLFSFKTEDLLSRAWKHKAFEHLKTKWMYISFSDTGSAGATTQGIIPVQDENGNMLGGTSPASHHPELLGQVVRRETKSVRNELGRLEEYFEKMMEAVERNTDGVRRLAESRSGEGSSGGKDGGAGGGYFDSSAELATHFGRMTDLLQRNTEFTESLSKKQFEHERKLRSALEDVSAKQRADYLDMSQLSSHLDRIQSMMEKATDEREARAQAVAEPERAVTLDFSPLTSRLEKMQEAVEQNSALVKALLEEGSTAEAKPSTPFWGKETPEKLDLSPLTAHLEAIHTAIERQSSHMQALVGFASGGDDSGIGLGPGEAPSASTNLAPLGEHLEQIYNAIEDGNRHAKDSAGRSGRMDLTPLTQHLEAIQKSSTENAEAMQRLVDAQNLTHSSLESSRSQDLSPLEKKLDALHTSSKQLLNAQQATRSAIEKNRATATDLGPVTKQLEMLNASITEHFQRLLDSQDTVRTAIEQNGGEIDFTPLAEHMEAIKDALANNETKGVAGLAPLTEHLEAIRSGATAQQSIMREMVDAQRAAAQDVRPANIDFSDLAEHLAAIRSSSQAHEKLIGEMIEAQRDTQNKTSEKLDLTPLTEHLSAMRASTDSNAEHIKALLSSTQSPQSVLVPHLESIRNAIEDNSELDFTPLAEHFDAMRSATEDNSEHLRSLLATNQENQSATLDLTPLTDRLNKIHASLEKAHSHSRDQTPGVGDGKFLMSALTSHLSKIQAVTEQNAVAVRALREKHSASQDKMHIAVAETSETAKSSTELVRRLAESRTADVARMEATESQVRELMAGQREMVRAVRELAESLRGSEPGRCGHVVIPPPRKVGRKIVGFVYDGKEREREGSVG